MLAITTLFRCLWLATFDWVVVISFYIIQCGGLSVFDLSKILGDVDKLMTKHAKQKMPLRLEIASRVIGHLDPAVGNKAEIALNRADSLIEEHNKTCAEGEKIS